MNNNAVKNWLMIILELFTLLLMILEIAPRELSLVITGILVFYFIFSDLSDSLWVFIVSLPLFVALPLTENFDTLANWRLLLIVIFLKWLVTKFRGKGTVAIWHWFKQQLVNKTVALCVIFLGVGVLSLTGAVDIMVGIKKIIFLTNIGLLFLVVKDLALKNNNFRKIFSASLIALGMSLLVGLGQLVSTFFVPLHIFWEFWSLKVIYVLYGYDLSKLLQVSNTWFAYYVGAPPTLRVFSVFPDSHSFALFAIIGLAYLGAVIIFRTGFKLSKVVSLYIFLILTLMTLLFTGSRGVWASSLIPFFGLLCIILLIRRLKKARNKISKWFAEVGSNKTAQLVLSSLIMFFILFPTASAVLYFSQKSQIGTMDADRLLLLSRARSLTDFSEISVQTRWQIWLATVESINHHPWLGVGIGNFPTVLNESIITAKRGSSAHNLYLDITAEMGFFALFTFLAIAVTILAECWIVYKRKLGLISVFALSFGLYFVWILSYSLFDVVLFNDKVLLFFMLSLGLIYGANTTKNRYIAANLQR